MYLEKPSEVLIFILLILQQHHQELEEAGSPNYLG